tara:strand:+ start:1827 stop:2975 length:1149 start_codon:yes stop_codon:yes gene_type:complete
MTYKPYLLKDVYDASAQNKFTVISTFAGGGGSSTGYRLAGGNLLCVNEFVEEARNTYKENYPNTPILPDDIIKLSGQEFLDISGLDVGELDILDGSPPCSAFSMAGNVSHGKGNTHKDAFGKTKGYSDIKEVSNIEDLFFEFLRVADVIKPKVIIAENVAGLTMGEAKQYFNKIQNTFEKIGYDVCAKVLNSSYFGVPQSRSRVFFIGVRSDITLQIGLTFMNIESIFPTKSKSTVVLKDALNNLEYDDEEIKTLTEKFTNTAYWRDTGSKMPLNPDKVLTGCDFHPKGHHFNLKRVSLEKPAPTLTAMGSNDTTAGAFHWNEPRKLTIGELKRIQSLPDDFILTGKWNQQSERIGRMVPPLLLKSVADSVYENVIKEYKNA